jgi:hypothetical protein
MLVTEFEFTLPRGLVDREGVIHRQGVMRLATAKDEITVQKDRRTQENPGYGMLVMFSLVINRLGTMSKVTPEMLESLFSLDLGYLREFYNRINQQGNARMSVNCPHCHSQFYTTLTLAGES